MKSTFHVAVFITNLRKKFASLVSLRAIFSQLEKFIFQERLITNVKFYKYSLQTIRGIKINDDLDNHARI